MPKGIGLMGAGNQVPWPGAGLWLALPTVPWPLAQGATCSLCTRARVLSLRTVAVGVGVPRPLAAQVPSACEELPCAWEHRCFLAEGVSSSTDLCSPDPISGACTHTLVHVGLHTCSRTHRASLAGPLPLSPARVCSCVCVSLC